MSGIVGSGKVPIEDLEHYPGNARRGDLPAIKESLRIHGQYRSIVANRRTGQVLAGNHTLQAARELGWTAIDVDWVDVDDDQARRIVLVDNRTNDLGGYDAALLAELLQDLDGDFLGTGWDKGAVDELLAGMQGGFMSGADKDHAPAPPAEGEAITQPGDVIELGVHRLVCGSSTDLDVVQAALGGQAVDLCLTDPPYGVAYQTDMSPAEAKIRRRRTDGKQVANDALAGQDMDEFVRDALATVAVTLKPGGVFYVFVPPGIDQLRFWQGLAANELQLRQVLLWVKDVFAFGRSDYHYRHEPILYGWRDGAAHFFVDDRTQDSVIECARPKQSKLHPTMKPVELLERLVANSSRPGELVFDPFGGSGSTLVAAAAQGRRAALIELDPGYCDVIVSRYEALTGQKVR